MKPTNFYWYYPDKILDFSSQYGSDFSRNYTFLQIIGPSTVYPRYEDSSNAAAFRYYGMKSKFSASNLPEVGSRNSPNYSSEDFFEFSIKYPLILTNFEIVENYNPGSVVRIFFFVENRWIKMWEKEQNTKRNLECTIFSPKIKKINKACKKFRVEVNQSENINYSQFDTVRVSGYRYEFNKQDDSIQDVFCPKNVENNENNYQSLSQQCRLFLSNDVEKENYFLNSKTVNSKTDYITQLPEEILIRIFSFLPMTTLSTISSVSKRFHSTTMTVLADIKELNLKSVWNRLDHDSLLWLSRRCPNVRRVDLSWVGKHQNFSNSSISHFFALSCCNLTTLRLCACRFVNDCILRCIASNCKNLRELDLSSCINITSSGFKVLKDLPICYLSLYRTAVNSDSIIYLLNNWPNLYYLNMGSCQNILDWHDICLTISQNCKKLRSLDVWRSEIDNNSLLTLIENCKEIEELDLGWCLRISSHGHALFDTNAYEHNDDDLYNNSDILVSMARHLTKLRKLHVTGNRTVSDNVLRALIKFCPNMQHLDVMGACSITPQYVSRLLENMGQLKMLDLSFCRHIRRIDFMMWRKVFPKCIILQSYQDVMGN